MQCRYKAPCRHKMSTYDTMQCTVEKTVRIGSEFAFFFFSRVQLCCWSHAKQLANHLLTLYAHLSTKCTSKRYSLRRMLVFWMDGTGTHSNFVQFCGFGKKSILRNRQTVTNSKNCFTDYTEPTERGKGAWYQRGIFLHNIFDFFMHIDAMKLCVKRR